MQFCLNSSEAIISGSTTIDNIFFNEYLPEADPKFVKVYLYGMYKAMTPNLPDNTLKDFTKQLSLTEDEVYLAFKYWEEQDLVTILETDPFTVKYLPIKNLPTSTKRYKADKYSEFNKELEAVLAGRPINLAEYNAYYDFMECYHMDPDALLQVIRYCLAYKNKPLGYRYFLTVAKSWALEGILTYEKVEERLIELEQRTSEIGELFKVLGINRVATIEEREYLDKWKTDYEYSFDTIIGVCKLNKKNKKTTTNFDKLDIILRRYYEARLFTLDEIKDYETRREELNKISRTVCKNLGIYYEDIEPVSVNYTSNWSLIGFNSETLEAIANYCFRTNTRSLEGMNAIIQKFKQMGILSKEALEEYLNEVITQERKIQSILDELGIVRNVNKFDRDFYRTWTKVWNMSDEMINEAVILSKDKTSAMQYLNKILSSWHLAGLKTAEQCRDYSLNHIDSSPQDKNTIKTSKQNYKEHRDYSNTDLNALFDNLEEIEL